MAINDGKALLPVRFFALHCVYFRNVSDDMARSARALNRSGAGFTCLYGYAQRAELSENRLGEQPTARVKAVLKALADL